MNWFVRRNLFAGVAGACVVGLGIAMVWPIFSSYSDERLFDDLRSPRGHRRAETCGETMLGRCRSRVPVPARARRG